MDTTFCRNIFVFLFLNVALAVNNTGPPIVKVYSKPLSLPMHLNCSVESLSKPTIKWYKNHANYSAWCGTVPNVCKATEGYSGGLYWSNLTQAYPHTDVTYTCVARNEHGNSSESFTTPCIGEGCIQPAANLEKKIKINTGESTSILCQFLTIKTSHVKQCYEFSVYYNNHSFSVSNLSLTYFDGQKFTTISYSYTVANASKNNSGVYTCSYNLLMKLPQSKCNNETIDVTLIVADPPFTKKRYNFAIVIAVAVCSVVCGLIIVLLIFCLRRSKIKSSRLYDSNPELRWDVFISYSSKDFVWVKELCETLEQPPFNLSVCLHQRDWEVGRTILDNMAESIYCSHKTLLIVSKSYIESSFCMQELNIATECEGDAKLLKDRVIVIKLDDVSLKSFPKSLRQKSYLDFSNTEQRKHYKIKLLKALPKRGEVPLDNEESNDSIVEDIMLDQVANERKNSFNIDF